MCALLLSDEELCLFQFDSTALEASIQEVRVANMQLKADTGKTVEKLRTLTQRLEILEKRPAQVIAAGPSMNPARYSETPPVTPPGPLASQNTAAPRTFSQMPSVAGRSISSERSLAPAASTAASTAAAADPCASSSAEAVSGAASDSASMTARRQSEALASTSSKAADPSLISG